MSIIPKAIKAVLVWSYNRGTIQYDIICILILAFVFLVPPSCFVAKKSEIAKPPRQDIPKPRQEAQTNMGR